MRKLALLLLTAILVSQVSFANPANRAAIQMPQPDGSMLSLRLVGDEHYHFNTTNDGYTVMLNDRGAYVYARLEGEHLAATQILAHDADSRGLDEIAFLEATPKFLTDRAEVANTNMRRAPQRVDMSNFDFENFRGVVILIDFTDKKFTPEDPQAFYTNLFNTEGMTSFYDPYLKRDVSCFGSVHDYFNDQSNGAFAPQFDVYGPYHGRYTKNGVQYDALSTDAYTRHNSIFQNALKDADPDIDFTKYNSNGDKRVDMVFFLVAGYAKSYPGNNEGYLWPHASNLYLYSIDLDGLWMDRYASSTELFGSEHYTYTVSMEGIGTACHEFSHVLGLPDIYDTDYEESGGESHHPGGWDIMAGGGDYDNGRAPVGYTFFERYSLGWANAQTITRRGTYTLNPGITSREGYILRTDVNGEFFTIENRQKTGWDTNLPGHGMIVTRVDSTDTKVWSNNTLNCDPTHNYFQMLRAGNTSTGDLDSDPFPGSTGNPIISNETFPSLMTWGGYENKFNLMNITEADGIITFDVVRDNTTPVLFEDFEDMAANSSTTDANVEGNFASWTFNGAGVRAPGAANATDEHSAMLKIATQLYTVTPVYYNINLLGFKAYNNTNRNPAKYRLEYSIDGGNTWTVAMAGNGQVAAEVPGKSRAMCYWPLDLKNNQGSLFRITQVGGMSATYIDDITIYYTGKEGGPDLFVPGDVNGDNEVNIADVNAIIDVILNGSSDASLMQRADVDLDKEVSISDINALIDMILK